MVGFFKEEAVLILIALFIFGIAIFISTRDFVAINPKKFLPLFALILFIGLFFHYSWRMDHIKKVTKAFNEGKTIECIDKTSKLGGVVIKKGEWRLEKDTFINPSYYRSFNVRHCIVEGS